MRMLVEPWTCCSLLYDNVVEPHTYTIGNIIKDNDKRNTSLYKYISHPLFSKEPTACCCLRDRWRDISQREDFFFPYLLPGARGCQRLHPLASSSETPLIGCVSHARLWFSARCLNLTTRFSSRGLLLVTYLLYPSALIVMSCLLITM